MKDLLDKIHTRAYWRINFQPLVESTPLNIEECKNLISSNSVHLRGWSYPFFPNPGKENQKVGYANNYVSGYIDWTAHKEYWRMYQSRQFIHHFAIWLDWIDQDDWWSELLEKVKPLGSKIGVNGSFVYQITEIYIFLSRLCQQNIYTQGVELSLTLSNIEGKELYVDDPYKWPLLNSHKASVNEIVFSKKYTDSDLVKDPSSLAMEAIVHFLQRFGWTDLPLEAFSEDQKKLITKSQ